MNHFPKRFVKKLLQTGIVDLLLLPFVSVSAICFLIVKKLGLYQFPYCRKMLLKIGILPIRDHYYEPLFHPRHLRYPLSQKRNLSGINWDEEGQLGVLSQMNFAHEINAGQEPSNDTEFSFGNNSYEEGDADFWYNIIRLRKPKRIIEIGSGHSTKIARLAIEKNKEENKDYHCEHICIEPYEMPWLEKLNIDIVRKKVEEIDVTFFQTLTANDILFVDSSHIIRPQGDVLYVFLEILPVLNTGVIVHVHDIFTPNDYPADWFFRYGLLWNEQYLLEAFLTHNQQWKVLAGLHFLQRYHPEKMKAHFPNIKDEIQAGSFYMEKLS